MAGGVGQSQEGAAHLSCICPTHSTAALAAERWGDLKASYDLAG